MKFLNYSLGISLCVLIQFAVNAQGFKGKVYYTIGYEMDINLNAGDSMGMEQDQNAMIRKMLMESMREEFELKFNRKQSIYKKEETLGSGEKGGVQVNNMDLGNLVKSISNKGSTNFIYKDLEKHSTKEEKDFLGKIFLVNDKMPTFEWKLEKETKKIGNYSCFKATTEREQLYKEDENEEVSKRTITVWYTMDIPISNGPEDYWGLPGLILEVRDGNKTILCNKVVLNTKDNFEIEEPSRRKEHTREEYDEIVEKKFNKMKNEKGAIVID